MSAERGRRLRVGVLELLALPARNAADVVYHGLLTKQFASVMPQAVAAWCRRRGHRVDYAIYYGIGDPGRALPRELDLLFVCCHTQASPLAYALAKLYRAQGTRTVLGGPHARAFPSDSLRFFDLVCGECDEALVADILAGQFDPGARVASTRPLEDIPTLEERLPDLRTATFYWRRLQPPVRVVPMLASLGCPYACDFCTDWNSTYRLLPLERLEADLRFLSERLPGVGTAIHDPNFAVKFDPVLDVMERIPEGRRPPYLMESTLSVLRGPRLRRLRETNCVTAAPGVESWAGYSHKAGLGRSVGLEKVESVAAQLAELHEHVPYLQVNLMFGLDGDRGDEPVALTRHFMDRTPFAWPVLNIPVPFGGTPFYDSLQRAGRILETMPFLFYYAPYLVTTLRHYDPAEFYERLIALFEHAVRPALLKARLATARTPTLRFVHRARTASTRRAIVGYRALRDRLRSDARFRAFHEGRSTDLPAFYAGQFERHLGRYASLLSAEERRPLLDAPGPAPGEAAVVHRIEPRRPLPKAAAGA